MATFLLAGAPMTALGAPASAGAQGPPQLGLGESRYVEGARSSPLSTEALPTVHVQVGSLVNVEASPLPAKVEVAGLPPIETPSLPRVETPSPPPVETPRLPVETPTTPPVSTPVPIPAGSSSSPGQPASSSQGGAAHAANAGSSTASGGSGQTSKSGDEAGSRAAPTGQAGRSLKHRARSLRAAGAHRRGADPAGHATHRASPGTSTPAGGSLASDARVPQRTRAGQQTSTSNPLTAIGRQIPFPVPVPDWSKPIILALLLLAIALAVRARLATSRARRLEAQQATMLSDLDEMQKALVPAVPERLGGLSVSVAYRPADGPAAGGDFYDLFALESGKVAIILGDVVGHGREALAQAALTRYTLRAYLQAGLEPRSALALAGSVLSAPGEKRFATVVLAVFDDAKGELTYSCAGHPPPIAIGFDTPEPVTVCCCAPICCDLPTGHRQTVVSLPKSGGMCFFSDGLPEARTSDGLLGRERLSELLAESGPSVTAPALLERVRQAAPATVDDMVACIVTSVVRAPASAGQVEELEVDPEMLRSARVRRFLEACGVGSDQVFSSLAKAIESAGRDGRALLRVERPCLGSPTVHVTPAPAAPGAAAVLERAGSTELALALSSGR